MSAASAPRLAALPVEKWDDDARAALRGYSGDAADRYLSGGPDAPRVPNVLGVLMHHPRLNGPRLAYSRALVNDATLDARHRELLILRVAWRTRAEYEWLQHVRIAQRIGMTPEEIEAVGRGADAGVWTPLEADLLSATDQLIDHYCVDDATWVRLAEELDDRRLVELCFVVGTYVLLAMAFKTLGVELDPDLDPNDAPRLPASAPDRVRASGRPVTVASHPRVVPLPVEQFDDEAVAALRAGVGPMAEQYFCGPPDAPPLPNVLGVLMRHPRVSGPWLAFNGVLLGDATIEPRQRELMTLRVLWRLRAGYEWVQHVRIGKRIGITSEEIEAIARGAEAGEWTPVEADLFAATDQMLDHYRVDDATWARLADHFDERQLVELTFVVGVNACVGMVCNSLGVEVDAYLQPNDAPPLPEWED